MLHLADGGLDDLPQVSGGDLALGQEVGQLVVADRAIQQAGEAGGGRSPKRRKQIIGIQV